MDEFGKVMAKIDDSLSYLKDHNGFWKYASMMGCKDWEGERECLWEKHHKLSGLISWASGGLPDLVWQLRGLRVERTTIIVSSSSSC
jgi:hypothetical protein